MDSTVEAEFTAFVHARSHALLRAAYVMTGNQHAAEDLVQSALTKTYLRWRKIDGEPEAYARRIIYHDFVSGLRRHRKVKEYATEVLPEVSERDDHADDTGLRLLFQQVLLSLPPRQRAVVVLRYFEDLSVDETAAVLGCRRGTVASQAARALDKLRQLLPDTNGDLRAVTIP